MSLYASTPTRIAAKSIDFAIVIFVGWIIRLGLGSLLGFAYSLCADGLPFQNFQGQSIGKKMMRIRVLSRGTQSPLRASVIRNLPFGFITLLMIIPFWGWILSLFIGIPLAIFEISMIARAEKKQRLGDDMADTVVVVMPEPAST